jgi:hypothetical protein
MFARDNHHSYVKVYIDHHSYIFIYKRYSDHLDDEPRIWEFWLYVKKKIWYYVSMLKKPELLNFHLKRNLPSDTLCMLLFLL